MIELPLLDQCCKNCHSLVDRPNSTLCVDGRYHRIQCGNFVLLYLILFSRCLLIVVSINCLGIRVFGELEFWFASTKVTTLIGLIIFGITVGQLVSFKTDIFFGLILPPDLGGNPYGDRIGFRYWQVICLVTIQPWEDF